MSEEVKNSPEKETPVSDWGLVGIDEVAAYTRHIEGKVLTLIESLVTNETQLEAAKSIARSQVWNGYGQLSEYMRQIVKDTEKGYMTPFPFFSNGFR